MTRILLSTSSAPSVRRALAAFSSAGRGRSLATALCLTTVAAGTALAAPPANDNFASAAEITGELPLSVTGTNVEATLEPGEPAPRDDPDAGRTTIWWRWTAPVSGVVDIYTEGGLQDPEWSDDTDEAVHAVYTGDSLAALTPVAGVPGTETPPGDPWVFASRFQAVAGTVYRIQAKMNFADVENTITLRIKPGPPAPPNDTFADAAPLTTGVTAAGTPDGASLEAGEPIPPLADPDYYPSTVWWKWTAPAPGWYTVRLKTPDYGPLLTLWKGTALSSLTVARSVPTQGYVENGWESFIYFQAAAAGEVFPLSVGGDSVFGEPLTLTIASSAGPPLRNTSLTLTPTAVDVTAGPATAVAEFHLVSAEPVTAGGLEFGYLPIFRFGPAQRISGTATDGAYRVPLVFPAFMDPGELSLNDLYINNPYGPLDHHLGDNAPAPIIGGGSRTITVSNSGPVDSDAPELKSVTVSPTSVTLSADGKATVTVTLRITDALSGFDSGELYLSRLGGDQFDLAGYGSLTEAVRTSGDARDGIYTVPVQLQLLPEAPAGDFYFTIGNLTDGLENSSDSFESTAASFPGPFQGAIRISRPGGEPPVTFGLWAERLGLTGADAALTADPDGDGVTNLVEYALGMNPRSGGLPEHATADAPGLPSAVPPGGAAAPGPLTLRFWLPSGPDQADLVFKAQFSGDGSQWTDVPASSFTPDPARVIETPYGQRRLHTVTDPAGAVTAPRMGRVVVTTAP